MPRTVVSLANRSQSWLAGPTARVTSVLVLILFATGLGLAAEGRRWWCEQGDWWPWSTGIHSGHTSQHLVDPYSLTHLLHGVLFYAGLWVVARRWPVATRLVAATVVEAVWELGENSHWGIDRYRTGTVALGYEGDSLLNSVGDILACVGGFLLAARLPVRATVVLFLLVDAGLVVVYRDNLLLNMLMLVHPIEAVRRWQAGG